MVRAVFILFISNVVSETRSLPHMYLSGKSISNVVPTSTAYVYDKDDNVPESYITYGDNFSDLYGNKAKEKLTNSLQYDQDLSFSKYTTPSWTLNPGTDISISFTDYPIRKYSTDYEIAKAEAKYDSNFLRTKMETDAEYARLRSIMHFHPHITSNYDTTGFGGNGYRMDDDDFGINSRNIYDGWPYFYHTPYEYEHMKTDSEIKKAHEKRNAGEDYNIIIPVYEDFNENFPYSYESFTTQSYPKHNNIITTTDNPIVGNQPFFSFVLNDYFNNGKEDDSFVFKEYDSSNEFDQIPSFVYLDEYGKRNRQFEDNFASMMQNDRTLDSLIGYNSSPKTSSTVYADNDKMKEFVAYDQGAYKNDKHLLGFNQDDNKNKGFKEFVNEFANKFGKENNNKNSKYTLKTNQDNSENKRDSRKVYQTNEFEEEDNFYDNKNSSGRVEQSENSTGHISDSELLSKLGLQSLSDNKSGVYDITGDGISNNYHNIYRADGSTEGMDRQLNIYKDTAEKVALNNDYDY